MKQRNNKVDAVHVGMHKTGTTFLQMEFFPLLEHVNVLSNELLSGRPFYTTLDDILQVDEREYYAQKIFEQYGDVKIILGVRDPLSHMISLYSEYLRGGGCERFNVWKRVCLNWRYLEVKSYINILNTTFSNVFIYEYESLSQDKQRVLRDMCDFLGCDLPEYRDVVHRKGFNMIGRTWAWLRNRFGGN
jgi:hypothetical protein